mmetsp:Transcript_3767/g.14763  ORF Transcript_3767/g.14763 Transcript_3767/m.14763 type:complete len:246 (+) Transcript_3767:279-1016(+)
MFLPTLRCFSVVFCTSDTSRSSPSPRMRMSYRPLNSPNDSMPIHVCKFSAVSTSGVSATPCCSQCVTASRVRDRKMLPFDHVLAPGSDAFSLDTVVPLPVPLKPTRVTTKPLPSCGSCAQISAATWSADLPSTSTTWYAGGVGMAGKTPRSTAFWIPTASFWASSASRVRIDSPSRLAMSRKVGFSPSSLMIRFEVLSSWLRRAAAFSVPVEMYTLARSATQWERVSTVFISALCLVFIAAIITA